MSVPQRGRKPPAGPLGTWIAQMLRSRRWTQADLAHAMGIDQSQVSKWVRGSRTPDVPHCEGIARAFGVPAYEVLKLAGRVPEHLRVPTGHPVRDRVHALVDVLDPDLLALYLPLLERHAGDANGHRP